MEQRVYEAIAFALKAHKNQKRKGSPLPYIFHPMGAARILIEQGFDEKLVIAALLHDTIEDTSITSEEITAKFGREVADLVTSVSEISKKHSWQERKENMIFRFKKASLNSLRLSIVDKIDNLESLKRDLSILGEKLWDRFFSTKEQQKWYYQEMGGIFKNKLSTSKDKILLRQFTGLFYDVFK